MPDATPLLVRMDPALKAAIRAAAEREDRTMSSVVREALRAYVGMEPRKRPTAALPTRNVTRGELRVKTACAHPIGRRVGNQCAACGATVK